MKSNKTSEKQRRALEVITQPNDSRRLKDKKKIETRLEI